MDFFSRTEKKSVKKMLWVTGKLGVLTHFPGVYEVEQAGDCVGVELLQGDARPPVQASLKGAENPSQYWAHSQFYLKDDSSHIGCNNNQTYRMT